MKYLETNSTNHKTDSSNGSLSKTPLRSQDSEPKINRLSSSSSAYFSNQITNEIYLPSLDSCKPISNDYDSEISDKEDKEDFLDILTPQRPVSSHRHPIKIKLTDSSSLGLYQTYSHSKNNLSSIKSVAFKKKLFIELF